LKKARLSLGTGRYSAPIFRHGLREDTPRIVIDQLNSAPVDKYGRDAGRLAPAVAVDVVGNDLSNRAAKRGV
jgi:hypothetical protein